MKHICFIMIKSKIKKQLFLITAMLTMAVVTGLGQALKPFPQDVNYPYGFRPTTLLSQIAQITYDSWKNLLLTDCNGGYRIKVTENPNETKVEAIGFGMLLTSYYGEKDKFDGIYAFYKSKRTANANNMMAWNVTCDGIIDPGSATDGDIDVAFSLIVAYNQWGGEYLNEAKSVIQVIKNSVVITCNNLLALAPGYSSRSGGRWGGCNETDIQYYTPAFFRIFAEVTGDAEWNKLADDTYTILNAAANPNTGLVPDWQSVSGVPGGDPPKHYTYYRYDACRVPWRMALDYLWNGNTSAKEWCTKISNWANNIGPANIKDGYNLDGTENSQGYHNSAFVGGFAVAAMCNSQTVADAFGTEMSSGRLTETYWFNLCTRAVYVFAMTGNFWKPSVLVNIQSNSFKPLNVYPNPTRNQINIEGGELTESRFEYEVVELNGKVLLKGEVKDAGNKIDVSSLQNGLYFIKLNFNNKFINTKVIKY